MRSIVLPVVVKHCETLIEQLVSIPAYNMVSNIYYQHLTRSLTRSSHSSAANIKLCKSFGLDGLHLG